MSNISYDHENLLRLLESSYTCRYTVLQNLVFNLLTRIEVGGNFSEI